VSARCWERRRERKHALAGKAHPADWCRSKIMPGMWCSPIGRGVASHAKRKRRYRLAERARKRREYVATMLVWPHDMTNAPAAVRRRLRKNYARRVLP
jgi:hypothetical protein